MRCYYMRSPAIYTCQHLSSPPCPSAGSSVGQGGEGMYAIACCLWLVLTISIFDVLLYLCACMTLALLLSARQEWRYVAYFGTDDHMFAVYDMRVS